MKRFKYQVGATLTVAAVAASLVVGAGTAHAAPPQANDDTLTVTAGTGGTVNVLANDTGDTLTVHDVKTSDKGTVPQCKPTGECFFNPAGTATGYTDFFDYEISDGHGGTDIGRVTVTVNPGGNASPTPTPTATSPGPTPSVSTPPPPVQATTKLTLSFKNGSFRGKASSAVAGCRSNRKVTLHKGGTNAGHARTSSSGLYSIRVRHAKGKYYATVAGKVFTDTSGRQVTCNSDRSPTVDR